MARVFKIIIKVELNLPRGRYISSVRLLLVSYSHSVMSVLGEIFCEYVQTLCVVISSLDKRVKHVIGREAYTSLYYTIYMQCTRAPHFFTSGVA